MKNMLAYLLIAFSAIVVIYTIQGAASTVIGFSRFEDTPILVKLLVPLVTIGTISSIIFSVAKKFLPIKKSTKE